MPMKSNPPDCSYFRLFHALPTAESFDLYLDDMLYTKDFLYEDFTLYKPISLGEHTLKVCPHKESEPIYERTFWISEKKIYTLVLTYTPNTTNIQGYLLNEPPKAIPEEHLLIRVGNFSQCITPLTLHLVETKPLFKKVPLRQTSSYLSFLPTTAAIELLEIENGHLLTTTSNNTFKISRYYTLYVIGGIENYPLKWVQTIDGNSFIHF
ncbi:MAG: DUF4397 domain-containing protein [Cellulosilyticum sp.]|nr:DUF4397 domain-containing protein [Cellulosilyticum sp.]